MLGSLLPEIDLMAASPQLLLKMPLLQIWCHRISEMRRHIVPGHPFMTEAPGASAG